MLDKLIETGNTFKEHFTAEYNFGAKMGIDEQNRREYLKWIAKLGVYCEAKLKPKYPDVTSQILLMVKDQSVFEKDYEIIMGYLESVRELESE